MASPLCPPAPRSDGTVRSGTQHHGDRRWVLVLRWRWTRSKLCSGQKQTAVLLNQADRVPTPPCFHSVSFCDPRRQNRRPGPAFSEPDRRWDADTNDAGRRDPVTGRGAPEVMHGAADGPGAFRVSVFLFRMLVKSLTRSQLNQGSESF